MFDFVNGLFGVGVAGAVSLSVRRVYRDREVRGVCAWTVVFFVVLGFWNLLYYVSLGQWWSWASAVVVAALNTLWCAGIVYYSWRPRAGDPEATAAYAARRADLCIRCGSAEVEGGPVEIEGAAAYQDVTCCSCNASWTDVYTLSGTVPDATTTEDLR